MTRKQTERYMNLVNALCNRGLTTAQVDSLLRIGKTLHRWAERECNGEVERDEATGKTYGTNAGYSNGTVRRWLVPDRETGALKRAQAIIADANGKSGADLSIYHQGDPRGCSLYVIRPGDVPEGSTVDSCYNRGISVCVD